MTGTILLTWLALLLPVQEAPPADEGHLEELFGIASLWQVGENVEKVARARQELIALGDEALRFILEKKLSSKRGLEWRAISAVVMGNGAAAVKPLQEKLGTGSGIEKRNAVRLLGMLGSRDEDPEMRERIVSGADGIFRLLEEEDPRLRAATFRALAALQPPDAVLQVTPFLGAADEATRREAAVALGGIGDPRAVPQLTAALGDALFSVRGPVARALAKIQTQGRDALRKTLRSGADPRLRGLAAEALGQEGAAEAVDDLLAALADPSAPVRAHAAEALGRLGDGRALEPIRQALARESDPFPRWALEKALSLLEEKG